jgi:hypothetical protein
MATVTATTPSSIKFTGVLAALVVLGVVMFALPPGGRLAVAGVIIVAALLYKGSDTAGIINSLRQRIYGQ